MLLNHFFRHNKDAKEDLSPNFTSVPTSTLEDIRHVVKKQEREIQLLRQQLASHFVRPYIAFYPNHLINQLLRKL